MPLLLKVACSFVLDWLLWICLLMVCLSQLSSAVTMMWMTPIGNYMPIHVDVDRCILSGYSGSSGFSHGDMISCMNILFTIIWVIFFSYYFCVHISCMDHSHLDRYACLFIAVTDTHLSLRLDGYAKWAMFSESHNFFSKLILQCS